MWSRVCHPSLTTTEAHLTCDWLERWPITVDVLTSHCKECFLNNMYEWKWVSFFYIGEKLKAGTGDRCWRLYLWWRWETDTELCLCSTQHCVVSWGINTPTTNHLCPPYVRHLIRLAVIYRNIARRNLYLIEKVSDVFQVLWVLELVLANMKKYLYLIQVLWKVLDPNPGLQEC